MTTRPPRAPIISANIRVRHPDEFVVGDHSIVDDFCYFSTRVRIGICSHIASGCTVGGGKAHLFELGDFSSVSAGVRIWCASDDFARDLVALVPEGVIDPKTSTIRGDVRLGRYTAVGANSVVMPRNQIPEGTVIGALSLVPPEFPFEPWSVYAGIPVRRIRARDRDRVLQQARALAGALGLRVA